MDKTYTVYDKERDLQKELVEDRTLKPVYLKVARKGHTTELSLSRQEGGYLYCVSNKMYHDLLEYFGNGERPAKKPEEKAGSLAERDVKRKKQGSLFSFIKHE